MKEITLTKGYVALVDDEDYAELSQYKWEADNQGGRVYARRRKFRRTNPNHFEILMHRQILNVSDNTILVDHIDGNGLNNQRNNLRQANSITNCHNRKRAKNNTSGFKGVSWSKTASKWRATIRVNKQTIWLGHHETPHSAAIAYDRAAYLYFGEFAMTNEMLGNFSDTSRKDEI